MLPLSEEAFAALAPLKPRIGEAVPIFPVTYEGLRQAWVRCRRYLGVADVDGQHAQGTPAARPPGNLTMQRSCPPRLLRVWLRHNFDGDNCNNIYNVTGRQ